jgi:hypothetical protein
MRAEGVFFLSLVALGLIAVACEGLTQGNAGDNPRSSQTAKGEKPHE